MCEQLEQLHMLGMQPDPEHPNQKTYWRDVVRPAYGERCWEGGWGKGGWTAMEESGRVSLRARGGETGGGDEREQTQMKVLQFIWHQEGGREGGVREVGLPWRGPAGVSSKASTERIRVSGRRHP